MPPTLTSDTLTEKFHAESNEYKSQAASGVREKEHQQKLGSYTVGAEWASHFQIMPLFIQHLFTEPYQMPGTKIHTEDKVMNRTGMVSSLMKLTLQTL